MNPVMMQGNTRRGREGIVGLGLAILLLASSPIATSAQEIVPRPEGFGPVYACEVPGAIELEAREVHSWDAMADPDAFVARGVRIMADGSLLVIEPQRPAVYHVSSDYQDVMQIGRRGEGPGEYRHPHDAVRGPNGSFVVVERGGLALTLYDSDGDYQGRAQILANISSVAADDQYIYVASSIFARSEGARPLLSRYDPVADRWETMLEYDVASMVGRAPLYNFSVVDPIVRVGLDGEVYLGFAYSYRIWRVGEGGHVDEVVAGCLPPVLERSYAERRGAGGGQRAGIMIADFAVLEDGDIVVRVGLRDPQLRRQVERFDRNGERQATWLLPAESPNWAALHPTRPLEHQVHWNPMEGRTYVLELRPPGGDGPHR